jgi:hypothetical protein
MSDIIEVTEKEGVKIEEYQGNYSLIAMKKSGDKWYWKSCKYKIGRDSYSEKDQPAKVTLGTKETAISVLGEILAELTGKAKDEFYPDTKESDIPF